MWFNRCLLCQAIGSGKKYSIKGTGREFRKWYYGKPCLHAMQLCTANECRMPTCNCMQCRLATVLLQVQSDSA